MTLQKPQKKQHGTRVQDELNKLVKLRTKSNPLADKQAKPAIGAQSKSGVESAVAATGGGGVIDYEKKEVTSSDGIFVFETMVDKALL